MLIWSAKHFHNYVYGTKFQVILDPKDLSSLLECNRGNKMYSSRLTRWVDRLLPLELYIVQAPGCTLRLLENLSRYPSPILGVAKKTEDLWNSWFTVIHVNTFHSFLENKFCQMQTK